MSRKPKTIFGRTEIAHAWVYNKYNNGKEDIEVFKGRTATYHGHNGRVEGNQSFIGDRFYSYSTQIAQRYKIKDKDGNEKLVYLFNSSDYGPTTKQQLSNLRRAVPRNLNGVEVGKFGWRNYGYFPPNLDNPKESLKDAIEKWCKDIEEGIAKLYRMRDNRAYHKPGVTELIDNLEQANNFLDLGLDKAVEKYRTELSNVPKYAPKPVNPNKNRYKTVNITSWLEASEFISDLPYRGMRLFREYNEARVLPKGGITQTITTQTPFPEGTGKLVTSYKINLGALNSDWAYIRLEKDKDGKVSGVWTNKGVKLSVLGAIKLYRGMLEVIRTGESKQVLGYKIELRTQWGWWDYSRRNKRIEYKGVDIFVGCHRFSPLTIVSDYLYLMRELGKCGQMMDETELADVKG